MEIGILKRGSVQRSCWCPSAGFLNPPDFKVSILLVHCPTWRQYDRNAAFQCAVLSALFIEDADHALQMQNPIAPSPSSTRARNE
jgi:hypothetical protein